jgi:catechol 2,3-dioxygenase-like lactoylglutathione lyase family enzyme
VRAAPYFHVGLVVADVRAARDRWHARYGLDFTEIVAVEFDVVRPDGSSYFRRSEVCFSRNRAPYYELIQVGTEEPFGRVELGRIHHVAVWTPDAVSSCRRYRAEGGQVEAEIRSPGGRTRAWYTDPADTLGVRWEVQELTRRAWFDELIATGHPPGGVAPATREEANG